MRAACRRGVTNGRLGCSGCRLRWLTSQLLTGQ